MTCVLDITEVFVVDVVVEVMVVVVVEVSIDVSQPALNISGVSDTLIIHAEATASILTPLTVIASKALLCQSTLIKKCYTQRRERHFWWEE